MYLQNIIVRSIGKSVTFFIGIIVLAILVRVFGIGAVGRTGYMFAFVGVLAIFLNPGLANYYIRNIT